MLEFHKVMEALGSTIAWPKSYISKNNPTKSHYKGILVTCLDFFFSLHLKDLLIVIASYQNNFVNYNSCIFPLDSDLHRIAKTRLKCNSSANWIVPYCVIELFIATWVVWYVIFKRYYAFMLDKCSILINFLSTLQKIFF